MIQAFVFRCCEFFRLGEETDCGGVLPLEIDIADVEIGVITSFPFDNFPEAAKSAESPFEVLWGLEGGNFSLGGPTRCLERDSGCVGTEEC